jgi:hypothetical protein
MEQDPTTILLACLRYGNEAANLERITHVSADEWRLIVELAGRHNVTSLLYHHLQHLHVALPDDLVAELNQANRKYTLQTMRLYQELNKLLRLFHEKDIQVIVLKGAYLAEAVYEQIGLRTMRDIDLLVKKDDLLRIDQQLLALGCMPDESNRVITQDHHHFTYKLPGSDLSVEIHWTILDPNLPLQIDVEGLWSRTRHVTLAHASARAFCPEDLFLHLCLHTVSHAYTLRISYEMRIRMLCDIGEVVRRFGAEMDWQEMGVRARQWRANRAVYVISRLAQDLLEADIPADWIESLRPDTFEQRYLDMAREQMLVERNSMNDALFGSTYLPRLQGVKGLKNKLALLLSRLFPPPEILSLTYPVPANSWRIYLYYPVRIKYLLVRRGAELWRLVRGDSKTRNFIGYTNQITDLRDWLLSN